MKITYNKSTRLTEKRTQILAAANWAAKKLGISKNEVTVNIVFTHLFLDTFSMHAETHYDNPRHVTMLFEASPNKYLFLNTIMHEMVHVKQFVKGQLAHDGKGNLTWKGKKQPLDLPYWKQPWEIEAMQKADLMAVEYSITKGFVK